MASNIQYYEAILKEHYAPVIARQIWRKTALLQELEKSSDFVDMSGRYYYVPVELGLNEGIGAGGEYDPLPEPTNEITAGAKYFSVQQTAVAQLSIRAIQGGKGKEAVWEDLQSFKFESLTRNLRMDINRQLFGDGSGRLATCGAMGSAGNTIPVDSTKYLRVGMVIDIVDPSNGAVLAQKRKITAVTKDTDITIDGTAVQTTANHIITRYGAFNKECDGLAKIVSKTGAVGGIDPATPGFEEWCAAYVDETGGDVSLPLFERPIREIRLRGGTVDLIIASPGVVTAAANYLESFKRIPVDSDKIKLPGGFVAISWNGVALAEDADCPKGTAYFLALELSENNDEGALQFGQLGEPGWVDLGEGILKWAGDRTYKAVYIWDMNLLTIHRNLTAVVKNITEA
ncbi:phage major capsid protein [Caldanaerobius polysaccharolyticus]|uniref:phage major capsid protein n=1 Tax=Caldanaerobius polysaccharolyticus TaxID=44256 RepID=UPI00047D0CB1|nr:phage major capsid protein [Caldanaerobius polysaccharolyticus]